VFIKPISFTSGFVSKEVLLSKLVIVIWEATPDIFWVMDFLNPVTTEVAIIITDRLKTMLTTPIITTGRE
jgi:hypothetical protein